jgi:hypothetical protein
MTAKKSTASTPDVAKAAAASVAAVTPEPDLVQQAYENAVRLQVDTLFSNYVSQVISTGEADERFLTGLRIIRKARDRAIELVKGV